jgi:hypothetical protein
MSNNEEEEPICEKCNKEDCGAGAWGGLCVYVKYPNRCHNINGEWKQYMGAGHFCEPEIKVLTR